MRIYSDWFLGYSHEKERAVYARPLERSEGYAIQFEHGALFLEGATKAEADALVEIVNQYVVRINGGKTNV